jgi:hypothetical protein
VHHVKSGSGKVPNVHYSHSASTDDCIKAFGLLKNPLVVVGVETVSAVVVTPSVTAAVVKSNKSYFFI